jgi:hypothetical protein
MPLRIAGTLPFMHLPRLSGLAAIIALALASTVRAAVGCMGMTV